MKKSTFTNQNVYLSLVGDISERDACIKELEAYKSDFDTSISVVTNTINRDTKTFEVVISKQQPIIQTESANENFFKELVAFTDEFDLYAPHITDYIRGGHINGQD